jgi:hypothetical protein
MFGMGGIVPCRLKPLHAVHALAAGDYSRFHFPALRRESLAAVALSLDLPLTDAHSGCQKVGYRDDLHLLRVV